jgi:hypothetical protein
MKCSAGIPPAAGENPSMAGGTSALQQIGLKSGLEAIWEKGEGA